MEISKDTARTLRSETESAGLVAEWNRVTNKDDYQKILDEQNSDVIIADYDLPGLTGDEALEIRNKKRPGLPFLALSQNLDEQFIVKTMKSGATDYIFKGRLNRLVTSLRQIFFDTKKQSNNALDEIPYYVMANAFNKGLLICDAKKPDMPITYCNEAFTNITGYAPDEVLGKNCRFLQYTDRDQEGIRRIHDAIEKGNPCQAVIKNYDRNGKLFWNRLSISPIKNNQNELTHYIGLVEDISEFIRDKEKLDQSLLEKETLLKEIHHRVKNNLAILSGMMDLQSEYVDSTEIRKILKESKNRIKSMAIIHEKLYQSPSLSDIDFKDYLIDLLISIRETFDDHIKHINIDIDTPPVKMSINQAIPTALILNELVTNSFEHAFPSLNEGKVTVRITDQNGIVKLEIHDNGIGIPESVDMETPKSLGLLLVKALTKQLGGDIRFENDNGTHITLQFKLEKYS